MTIHCLDAQPYDNSGSAVSWETSSLREWLNGIFLQTAFDTDEQSMLLYSENTGDKVFILSYNEATEYYQGQSCMAASTSYALQHGIFCSATNGYCWQWLRTPGANYISSQGDYVVHGVTVEEDEYALSTANGAGGVRPCVWIDSSAYADGGTSLTKRLPVSLDQAKVGDTVLFGAYEQDGQSSLETESTEWLVLDERDGKLFLVSRYCLDAQPYDNSGGTVSWETSSLKRWLNETFMKAAFTDDEQKRIAFTDDAQDYIFLLSVDEAKTYLNNTFHAEPTKYARNAVYLNESTQTCWWWLRTAGQSDGSAAYISSSACFASEPVTNDQGGVRPAMWVLVG